jgi:hypothetical protein
VVVAEEASGTIELPPEEKPTYEPLLDVLPPEGVVGVTGAEAGPALETESPVEGAEGADEPALETESPVDGADGATTTALETESPVEGAA